MSSIAMEDIISTTELRRNTKKVFNSVQRKPQIVISNSKAVGVVLSPKEYKRMVEIIDDYNDAREIDRIMNSTKEGDYVKWDDVKDEFLPKK